MDVRAIVLVTGPAAEVTSAVNGGGPLIFADVLGRPALHHVVTSLMRQGVNDVSVLSETGMPSLTGAARQAHSALNFLVTDASQFWRTAENTFLDFAQSGADEVLVLRVAPYVELDVDGFLQAHLDQGTHVTRASHRGRALDMFVVTASRRNDAAYLFRHQLRECRSRCAMWPVRGYLNPLQTPQELRCLAVDALLGENAIQPEGEQVRPGVWVASGALVHPRARVLAPAYVGERAKVRANAVLTRCSVVERHSEVDFGSVIEDSTIAPYTYIGPGLDICRSVVGSRHVASIDHSVEVEIGDARLVDALPSSAGLRALVHAASLAAFLPALFARGLARSTRRGKLAALPHAVNAPSALNTPAGFPASTPEVSRTWQ